MIKLYVFTQRDEWKQKYDSLMAEHSQCPKPTDTSGATGAPGVTGLAGKCKKCKQLKAEIRRLQKELGAYKGEVSGEYGPHTCMLYECAVSN